MNSEWWKTDIDTKDCAYYEVPSEGGAIKLIDNSLYLRKLVNSLEKVNKTPDSYLFKIGSNKIHIRQGRNIIRIKADVFRRVFNKYTKDSSRGKIL